MLKIYDFSVNYSIFPNLIPVKDLCFGWKLDSLEKGVLQESYRIQISDDSGIIADSGPVFSKNYINVQIPDLVLKSKTEYRILLTVTDNKGNKAELTHVVYTEILPEEWDAVWIKPEEHIEGWAPYIRTKFEAFGVKKATMYACGLGCSEYYINGKRTDDYYIDPPATNYEKNILYRRWDVTDLMVEGGNALTVLLGEGFYSQSRVWSDNGLKYGDVCVIIRLELIMSDGSIKVITTNTSDWKYKYSHITVNNLYGGEVFDSRLEVEGFAQYESTEQGWRAVVEDTAPKGELKPCLMPPVRILREIPAVSVHCASGKDDGAWIFDIGENIAGIGEFYIPESPKGAVYTFRYSENLTANGQLDVRSTGSFATQCIQQDIYICSGRKGGEIYRTRFAYHGFRYVEVTGINDTSEGYGTMPKTSFMKAFQLATDLKSVAEIRTSNADLGKLLKVMKNTFVSNFHGYPEDCPAREKCGWLGDAQVVCNYGLLNFDSVSSYRKYMEDIRTTYEVYGTWQMISPGKRTCGEATPLWGCAQIIIPYYLYVYCGDTQTASTYFDLMEKWVIHELDRSKDYIISEGLGDWCPPDSNSSPFRMPVEHSSTQMFYEVCLRMEELCGVVGKGDPTFYRALAERIKESFIRNYYVKDKHSYGYFGTDGVALSLGLYPDGEREFLIKSLIDNIRSSGHRMTTAIYSNKYLIPELITEGFGEDVFKYLFNRNHSSFGTMLDDGATTLWEAVDMKNIADKESGVASYNHPMHGGFLSSVITHICGITPLTPGYTEIRFSPRFIPSIESISLDIKLLSGEFSMALEHKSCTFSVPAGVSLVIDIPQTVAVNGEIYSPGTKLLSGKYDMRVL